MKFEMEMMKNTVDVPRRWLEGRGQVMAITFIQVTRSVDLLVSLSLSSTLYIPLKKKIAWPRQIKVERKGRICEGHCT